VKTVRFRGVAVTGATPDVVVGVIAGAIASRRRLLISFVNPHSYNLMQRRGGDAFRADLSCFDLVLADGIGVVWAVRALLGERIDRLSFDLLAPDLLPAVRDAGGRVFLVGGRPGVAVAAGRALERRWPGLEVVGAHHGFADREELGHIVELISAGDPGLVLVGAGAPVQEHLALRLADRLPATVVATCGGYFDQIIRPASYYPTWAYPLRLNWLVRLCREPRRLWRRYLLGNPVFIIQSLVWGWRSWRARVSGRSEDHPDAGDIPHRE
jgi:N-acetylglucosaminyldiphosphoundecaprenol N-acetyl-beta-D-mannosaminyltransferase